MKQITIVTESRRGLTADIAALLAREEINIETLNALEVEGADVLLMTVDQYNRALMVLRDAGYPAVTEDALLVRLEDEPGALAKVAMDFKEADIPVRSIRIIRRSQGWGIIAISTDQVEAARKLLKDSLIVE
ncbi:MAG: hypothetical protein CMO74_15635 [Verrucomicrobiales bacterium]|nr:hypothetical protein [Verrucomicrobiales bacterium]|tara:strand:- start:363 stop:758 length:396 start_codon:yes stop_codon:yes gene_type:complete